MDECSYGRILVALNGLAHVCCTHEQRHVGTLGRFLLMSFSEHLNKRYYKLATSENEYVNEGANEINKYVRKRMNA